MGRIEVEDEIMWEVVIPALATLAGTAINAASQKKIADTQAKAATSGRGLNGAPQYNYGAPAVSDENLKNSNKVDNKNEYEDGYNYGAPAVSDEELKHKRLAKLFGEGGALDAFSKIDAYVYNYNDKAKQLYGNERGVDDETHFGPMAQDLAKNPVTEGTVHTDPETGYLNVDTKQLTLTNTAMIAQMARKINELEERLGGR